jgi:alpha-beta hydrolase superfamily lysophospholipase
MTDNSWNEPEGIAPRGTVIIAAGRGESTAAYGRFGRRIAADGYRVRALDDVTVDLQASLARAGKLLVDDSLPGPKVIAGSDTGALFALALAGRAAPGLDGVILAGLPVPEQAGVDLIGWPAEVEARTACPNHQRVLGEGAALPGALFSAPIPTELIEFAGIGAGGLPALGVHGGADVISPLSRVRDRYPTGAAASLVTIEGGRHDVLNDVTHRTVAALVVLFLERLRIGADLPLIAQVAP